MNTIIIKTAVACALIFGITGGGTPEKLLASSDVKTFPMAMCQTAPSGPGIAMYGYNGEIYNRHQNEALPVTCPLIRDVMAKGLYRIVVLFQDRHPTLDVTCRIQLYNAVTRMTTNVDLEEHQDRNDMLSFGDYSGTLGTAENDLISYTLSCSLPSKSGSELSRLKSFTYEEYD